MVSTSNRQHRRAVDRFWERRLVHHCSARSAKWSNYSLNKARQTIRGIPMQHLPIPFGNGFFILLAEQGALLGGSTSRIKLLLQVLQAAFQHAVAFRLVGAQQALLQLGVGFALLPLTFQRLPQVLIACREVFVFRSQFPVAGSQFPVLFGQAFVAHMQVLVPDTCRCLPPFIITHEPHQ